MVEANLSVDNLTWLPEKVIVEESAADDTLTKTLLSRLGSRAEVVYTEKAEDPYARGKSDEFADLIGKGKRTLILKRHLGSWLRACPGTSGHVCCNLFTVNPGEGCPLDCTYCYLQSLLRHNPSLKLYTNTRDMLAEIAGICRAEPKRFFRVGTGEVIDSLVWDRLSDSSVELVEFFAGLENAVLELKTKTDYVENLLGLEHRGNTVVSWSINAPVVSERDELDTATLEQRLAAASKVADAGYRVGFHFDPLIDFPGWQTQYEQLVEMLKDAVPPESIAWISISTLRYKPDMQTTMQQRFPQSKIPFGENFLAKDGKLRYDQPQRLAMISYIKSLLVSFGVQLPVYLCMESGAVWKETIGSSPGKCSELDHLFKKSSRLPVL